MQDTYSHAAANDNSMLLTAATITSTISVLNFNISDTITTPEMTLIAKTTTTTTSIQKAAAQEEEQNKKFKKMQQHQQEIKYKLGSRVEQKNNNIFSFKF